MAQKNEIFSNFKTYDLTSGNAAVYKQNLYAIVSTLNHSDTNNTIQLTLKSVDDNENIVYDFIRPGYRLFAHGIFKIENGNWAILLTFTRNTTLENDCGYLLLDSCMKFKKVVIFENPAPYDLFTSYISFNITTSNEVNIYIDNSLIDESIYYTYSSVIRLDKNMQVVDAIGTGNSNYFSISNNGEWLVGNGYNLEEHIGNNYTYGVCSNLMHISFDTDTVEKWDLPKSNLHDLSHGAIPYFDGSGSAIFPIRLIPADTSSLSYDPVVLQKIKNYKWDEKYVIIKNDETKAWFPFAITKVNGFYVSINSYTDNFKYRNSLTILDSNLKILKEIVIDPGSIYSNKCEQILTTDSSIILLLRSIYTETSSNRLVQYKIPSGERIDFPTAKEHVYCDTGYKEILLTNVEKIPLDVKYFNTSYQTSGLKKWKSKEFVHVYPSPANSTITVPSFLIGSNFVIRNRLGQTLYSGISGECIDISKLSPGLLFIQFNTGSQSSFFSNFIKL